MAKHLIFVYGTLKAGWGNNAIIHDQKCLGPASTLDCRFQMHSLGGFPGVVAGTKRIVGELWEVDDQAFARCDRLEGHPTFYKREQVQVTSIVGDKEVMWSEPAWIYIYQESYHQLDESSKIDRWEH